jgi:hypothetical protein
MPGTPDARHNARPTAHNSCTRPAAGSSAGSEEKKSREKRTGTIERKEKKKEKGKGQASFMCRSCGHRSCAHVVHEKAQRTGIVLGIVLISCWFEERRKKGQAPSCGTRPNWPEQAGGP